MWYVWGHIICAVSILQVAIPVGVVGSIKIWISQIILIIIQYRLLSTTTGYSSSNHHNDIEQIQFRCDFPLKGWYLSIIYSFIHECLLDYSTICSLYLSLHLSFENSIWIFYRTEIRSIAFFVMMFSVYMRIFIFIYMFICPQWLYSWSTSNSWIV